MRDAGVVAWEGDEPMTQLAAVTGRFQPVHIQHMQLFQLALAAHDELIVAVTNPDPSARQAEVTAEHRHHDAANPFTYYERVRLLTVALREQGLAERATVVPFDLTRPHVWFDYVPLGAHHYVRVYGPWEGEKVRRLRGAGYTVTAIEGDPAGKVSATAIRQLLRSGSSADWQMLVSAATVPLLQDAALRQERREPLGRGGGSM